MVMDIPEIIEYSVELGYGILYLLLTITTIRKYKKSANNKLALYFIGAFICLSISGLYGGIAGILNNTGFESLPILGNKVLEIYDGLAMLALVFFLMGLVKI